MEARARSPRTKAKELKKCLLKHLQAHLQDPVEINGISMQLAACIGIAHGDGGSEDASETEVGVAAEAEVPPPAALSAGPPAHRAADCGVSMDGEGDSSRRSSRLRCTGVGKKTARPT